ncbi:hypothetical protein BGZ65_003563 [Modicella reniformis]|uniref:DUF676 domain-containing protein n=1 Tax=Modicella reniformis TaxID=1440133 RepID=A0A9P6MHF9_9FUNG|nr:hypothetical protein BGZ65_003563 [Modicella reniformis]
MLSRTGEQLQLIDDYIERKPLLLVMSEPEGVFVKALARFKRRVLYCNIRNDRSVPFWTASFSDADPFNELEDMEIQYNNGYSSLIESFEHLDMETLNRLREERAESLKTTSFVQRTAHTLTSIPWKKYALLGLLTPVLPFWILFASTTISYQGLNSRRRTRNWTNESETLQRIREMASTTTLGRHKDDDNHDGSDDNITTTDIQDPSSSNTSSGTLTRQQENESHQEHTVVSVKMDGSVMESRFESGGGGGDDTLGMDETVEVSHSYPELKSVRPLALQPVQVEISRNLNKLEWSKNIVHIDAWNAHASIVVREKRFSNDGGTAAVQHVVDMFKEDGEDV